MLTTINIFVTADDRSGFRKSNIFLQFQSGFEPTNFLLVNDYLISELYTVFRIYM